MEITSDLARKHLLPWAMYSSDGFIKPYKHIARLSRILMEMASGRGNKRLIIQMPAQHGKSTLSTEYFSTWYLGRNPGKRVGIASYSAALAEGFGYRNKKRMEQFAGEVFGLEIDPTRKARADWGFRGYPNGGMVSIGSGGSLTGKRLDMLIVDDLIKGYEDASSATQREKNWNWLNTVAMTRLSKDAPVVVIGTRWHAEDHIGQLITQTKSGRANWDVLSLPAIAEEDEYDEDGALWRIKGEPLCPELHPLERLEEMKKQMSGFQWSAIYQQNPLTAEGSFWGSDCFAKDAYIDLWPDNIRYLVCALDPSSGTDSRRGDYPAFSLLGTANTGHFYVESIMKRLPPSGMCKEICQKIHQVKQDTGVMPNVMGVEQAGFSQLYAEMLSKEFASQGIRTPIVPIHNEGVNKNLRIQRIAPFISNRDIKFINTPCTGVTVQQFKDFPSGKHDDGPDSVEMCFRLLATAVR